MICTRWRRTAAAFMRAVSPSGRMSAMRSATTGWPWSSGPCTETGQCSWEGIRVGEHLVEDAIRANLLAPTKNLPQASLGLGRALGGGGAPAVILPHLDHHAVHELGIDAREVDAFGQRGSHRSAVLVEPVALLGETSLETRGERRVVVAVVAAPPERGGGGGGEVAQRAEHVGRRSGTTARRDVVVVVVVARDGRTRDAPGGIR